jgi:hypothetical protein
MKLRELPVGSTFQWQGESFKKVNDMGEFFGPCNVRTLKNKPVLIHPDTKVTYQKEK